MKIFAKESMVRQYKMDGFPFDVDLCFTVYKLVAEVDEDGHVYDNEEQHQIRQKLIKNLGFIFIRINLDVENFYLYVEIAKIYNYIKKSSVRLACKFGRKIFKRKACRRIIELHVKFF